MLHATKGMCGCALSTTSSRLLLLLSSGTPFVHAITVTKSHFPSLSIHMEVDESHLEPETPLPVEDLHDPTFILNPTPNRPARLSLSLSNQQRLSLLDIDGA